MMAASGHNAAQRILKDRKRARPAAAARGAPRPVHRALRRGYRAARPWSFDDDTALTAPADGALGGRDRRRLGDAARPARRLRDGDRAARAGAGGRRPGAAGRARSRCTSCAPPEAGPGHGERRGRARRALADHGQRPARAGRQADRARARRLLEALGGPAARRGADAGGRAARRTATPSAERGFRRDERRRRSPSG